jgi:hypothetical protein
MFAILLYVVRGGYGLDWLLPIDCDLFWVIFFEVKLSASAYRLNHR